MKIAIIYNRDSQAVINLFGIPNREKYGLETIAAIKEALEAGGHQVKAFEGDKNVIQALEEFMPTVISGERPGLVFNLSYGIQGRARYAHIPGILEMLGIPYIGSAPETHTIVLDKVLTKIILLQKGLPTPKFTVLERPDFTLPLGDDLEFPLIIKPKGEAVSFGLKIVNNNEELREGVEAIYGMFKAPTLVEEYIDGREFNVGLLGNDPIEIFPPVEIIFKEGERIFTYEDKIMISGRHLEKVCPAPLEPEVVIKLKDMALGAYKALECFDSARVDFRLDADGNLYILEVNSMPSLEPRGSYVYAAEVVDLGYRDLINRLIEIASQRYFGPLGKDKPLSGPKQSAQNKVFNYLTQNRDRIEEDLSSWTNLPSWTGDTVGQGALVKRLENQLTELGLQPVEVLTDRRSAWMWHTVAGFKGGTLLLAAIDVPRGGTSYPIAFRRDPEWLYGEGIASSRAGITCILQALNALKTAGRLNDTRLGVFAYADEGKGLLYSDKYLQQAAALSGRVIIFQPGFMGGKVVDQRRGLRKYDILVEGAFQRIGAQEYSTDVLSWFLRRAKGISSLSRPQERLTVAVQEIHSDRYSLHLPHQVRATVYVTFLDMALADQAEARLRELFTPKENEKFETRVYFEKLEERPPFTRSPHSDLLIARLKKISEDWKLPFGVESSLLPSAAGEIPEGVPVICGFGPASRDMFTPDECVHRGELLQRALLLSLFLLEN